MTPPKEPTPSDRVPTSAPFTIPSPFPARPRRGRARRVTVWTIVGAVAAGALQWLLSSRGVPAPVVDEAGKALQRALPR